MEENETQNAEPNAERNAERFGAEPARLLVDRMLIGLGRRLRLLGYDCTLVPEDLVGEKAIFEVVERESRTLITTSRRLHEYREESVCLVPTGDLRRQVLAIVERFPIDFATHSFTRCSLDNAHIEEVDFERVATLLPERVRETHPHPIYRCPVCARLYWPGTHLPRVAEEFQAWTGIKLPLPEER